MWHDSCIYKWKPTVVSRSGIGLSQTKSKRRVDQEEEEEEEKKCLEISDCCGGASVKNFVSNNSDEYVLIIDMLEERKLLKKVAFENLQRKL